MYNYTIFKESKYKNRKCEYKGIVFDSKKERDYYINLEAMQKIGRIRDLKMQVPFVLIETFRLGRKTFRQTKYIADFTYIDKEGKYHVVDVKGYKTKEYQLKKKLMAWKYGILIEEV